MHKRKMKNSLAIVCIFILSGLLYITPVLDAEDQNRNWSSNYDSFRKHFKSLSPSEEVYCERLLREILTDLDTKNQCNGDDSCGLIDQEPFGATVPFPKGLSVALKAKMKEYCERCDDGFFHIVKYDDLINKAVCIDGKCMVSTGFKKERSK